MVKHTPTIRWQFVKFMIHLFMIISQSHLRFVHYIGHYLIFSLYILFLISTLTYKELKRKETCPSLYMFYQLLYLWLKHNLFSYLMEKLLHNYYIWFPMVCKENSRAMVSCPWVLLRSWLFIFLEPSAVIWIKTAKNWLEVTSLTKLVFCCIVALDVYFDFFYLKIDCFIFVMFTFLWNLQISKSVTWSYTLLHFGYLL